MDDKTAQMMNQLKNNPALLQSLMRSGDGQALMQMLTRSDQGAGLQRAVQSAAKGNPKEIMQMMNRIMQSPDGAALVQRINQAIQKK